ncbi:MAG: type II secretion system F family protein [Pseudomonadota bacterium]
MADFDFKALDREGREVDGVLEAADQDLVFEKLRDRGLSPLSIRPKHKPVRLGFGRSITKKDLTRQMRQLSTLLASGVPLLEAIDSLSRSDAHPELAERARGMRRMLRAGGSLSEALEKQYPTLPTYVPRLAELGEATGRIGEALTEAADQMEYEERVASEFRSALMYPAFLATTGTVIVLLMFFFIVPRFAELLNQSQANIPPISHAVISFSLWFRANWMIFLGGAAVVVIGLPLLFRSSAGMWPALAERLPVISGFQKRSELASWSRTLGGAITHGAELLTALQLAERGVRGPGLKRGLSNARSAVRSGKSLDVALDEHVQGMDRMTIDLVRTGRASGKVGEMLLFAANIYDTELREQTKRFTSLAEPVAIVLISLIVGTIVISIVLAMTSLYEVSP